MASACRRSLQTRISLTFSLMPPSPKLPLNYENAPPSTAVCKPKRQHLVVLFCLSYFSSSSSVILSRCSLILLSKPAGYCTLLSGHRIPTAYNRSQRPFCKPEDLSKRVFIWCPVQTVSAAFSRMTDNDLVFNQCRQNFSKVAQRKSLTFGNLLQGNVPLLCMLGKVNHNLQAISPSG